MKKTRTTLKDYFKKGAIPTEANFADLIDSMLNQEEDNISKQPNDPLKILATGVDEALINFFRTENNEQKLSWQVKQKPDGNKPGLNISDTAASRLFIESGTGNVGLGTTTPKAKLQVIGSQDLVSLRVGTGDTSGADFTLDVTAGQGLVNLVAGAKIKSDGGGYTFLGTRGASRLSLHDGAINFYTSNATSGVANTDAVGLTSGSAKMILTNTGNLGIGATTPAFRLHVKGSTSTDAELRLDPTKWSAVGDYGQISFGDANHYIRGEFANGMKFYDSNKFVFDGSNVGIGTVTPNYKLEVAGDISVGQKTDTPATGYGSKLCFNGASENTDPLWMARYNDSSNISFLRINLGDDNAGDQLQIGYTYSVDKKWYTALSVDTSGTVGIGSLQLKGFTGNDTDEWPNFSWYRDTGASWDEGLIKASSSHGKFGKAGFGIHMHQTRQFGLYSTGWDSLFAVEGGTGNTYVKGNLQVKGDLNITGAQNIVKVVTFTKAVKNAGKDTAGTWSVDYTSTKFTEVYSVFVVMQGFSIYGNENNTDFSTKGHNKSADAIPQHAYVRLTKAFTLQNAQGEAYCSESDSGNESDNTVLFTVVVMGRI